MIVFSFYLFGGRGQCLYDYYVSTFTKLVLDKKKLSRYPLVRWSMCICSRLGTFVYKKIRIEDLIDKGIIRILVSSQPAVIIASVEVSFERAS